MVAAGMFLLVAGWGIVLSAIVLFASASLRAVFVMVGVCLQVLGLALSFRGSRGGTYSGQEGR